MDEKLQRQLIRQLKLLNFWITTFGILLLAALAIIGYLLFQVITFVRDASENVRNLQQQTSQQLDVRERACSDGSFGDFLRKNTDACEGR